MSQNNLYTYKVINASFYDKCIYLYNKIYIGFGNAQNPIGLHLKVLAKTHDSSFNVAT